MAHQPQYLKVPLSVQRGDAGDVRAYKVMGGERGASKAGTRNRAATLASRTRYDENTAEHGVPWRRSWRRRGWRAFLKDRCGQVICARFHPRLVLVAISWGPSYTGEDLHRVCTYTECVLEYFEHAVRQPPQLCGTYVDLQIGRVVKHRHSFAEALEL